MRTITLNVVGINIESADSVTISFKQPALKKIKYQAGQYITLIFRINGRRYIRPYSFSSAPNVENTLDITVKRVSGGIISNHIIDKLKVGDLVEAINPMGDFVLQDSIDYSNKRIVLWGAGSGITPLMSIAKYALHNNIGKHVTIVYGNRKFETIIFNEQIKTIESKFADKLKVWHFLTEAVIDDNNPFVIQGRINPEKVLSVISNEEELQNTVHYICGPAGLKESVCRELENYGVNSDGIYFEDFEIVRDPALFEDIVTQNVTINAGAETKNVEVIKGKSILEAGLDAMLELSYSCQTGSCLLCRATLTQGKIKTIGIHELPEELNSRECLLCCSFPLTDDVCVTI